MASKKDLIKYLIDLTKEELEKEVEKLYSKFKEVKTYYAIELSGDTSSIVNEIKAKIKKEYLPDRGYGQARSAVVKKVIDDFAKISIFPIDLIDVILTRVEIAIEFSDKYGDINEAFYASAENAFEKALKLIEKHQLKSDFKLRCKEIVHSTREYGWGFHDELSYLYDEYYRE